MNDIKRSWKRSVDNPRRILIWSDRHILKARILVYTTCQVQPPPRSWINWTTKGPKFAGWSHSDWSAQNSDCNLGCAQDVKGVNEGANALDCRDVACSSRRSSFNSFSRLQLGKGCQSYARTTRRCRALQWHRHRWYRNLCGKFPVMQ